MSNPAKDLGFYNIQSNANKSGNQQTCDKLRDDVMIKSREGGEGGEKIMARAKSILPNSSLQCEHFFLPTV